MRLERILTYSKTLIKTCTFKDDITIDATVGNGNDTLFLAQLVGEKGKVYGFDVSKQAIVNTNNLLIEKEINNVTLFNSGHENISLLIPKDEHNKIASAIFNLGYLPNGDKSITTKKETTISAIKQLLNIIKINGVIVLVVYIGHKEGKEESEELHNYLKTLDQKYYQVLLYQFINQINDAPYIIAIEKIK